MIRHLIAAAGGILIAGGAAAQSPATTAETRTTLAPVAVPGTLVTKVAPGTFVVTPVPGIAAATRVKVQNFGDYDQNRDGVYNPMEFAQAIYFLATSDPVAGNPKLPAMDKYSHKGTPQRLQPQLAITLLNATADDFAAVDLDNDWRVSPAELAAVAML